MSGRIRNQNPYIQSLITRDMIAREYGWTYDYIDELPITVIAEIIGVMDARARYQKLKEASERAKRGGR